ncbi:unnamed protein product, partial [Allacma fusca]
NLFPPLKHHLKMFIHQRLRQKAIPNRCTFLITLNPTHKLKKCGFRLEFFSHYC